MSDRHIYVFVNIRQHDHADVPEYYVVPSRFVSEHTTYEKRPNSEWWSVSLKDISAWKDKWDLFGDPKGELKVEERSISREVQAPEDAQPPSPS
jgi:hypothetical protein